MPALCEYCEKEDIDYTIGLISNRRLEELAAPLLGQAQRRHERQGRKVRLLLAAGSYQAGSSERKRRVVYKAEVIARKHQHSLRGNQQGHSQAKKLYDLSM